MTSTVERQTPGSVEPAAAKHRSFRRPDPRFHRADLVFHRAALERELQALGGGDQSLFLEVRLLHQPMRQAAQKIGVRAAAIVAARPEPRVVRGQQGDAALALTIEDEKRLIFGAAHHDAAAVRVDFCLPEPAAPSW